jgi:hypothetical protein
MTAVKVITVQKAVMSDVGDTTSVKEAAKVEEIISGFGGCDSCCIGSSWGLRDHEWVKRL